MGIDNSKDSDLQLLLAYADEHSPVLPEGLEVGAAAQEDRAGEELGASSFYNPGAAGNDLQAQGWGVIAPEGDVGDRLLAAIAPLIAARKDQVGAEPPIYRVPPTMSASDADNWRRDVYESSDADEQPFYQLLLGDLDQVPLALQQAQSIDSCLGRLAFDDLSDYEAYAAKILRWERSPAQAAANLLLHTVNDGTPATSIGARDLVAPLGRLAREAQERRRLSVGQIITSGDPEAPAPDQLFNATDGQDGSLLFSLSHGEGAPRRGWGSLAEQRAGQGAMSFGRGGRIRGDDLQGRPFLPGGVWFMFACYGAGTPSDSRFRHWLQQLRDAGKFRGKPEAVLRSLPQAGERPFVASIPRSALANPDGPLAFIGHLDLAWTYSFQELDRGKKDGTAGKFYKVLRALLRGDRVGISLREITRAYLDKNEHLTNRYDAKRAEQVAGDPEVDDRIQMAHLWMARQELAGYTILGDPAAQLAGGSGSVGDRDRDHRTQQRQRAQAPIELNTAPTPSAEAYAGADTPAPVTEASDASDASDVSDAPPEASAAPQMPAAPETPAPAIDPAALDRRVEAVHAMIIGDDGMRALSTKYGVDRATLMRWLKAYDDAGREALGRLDPEDS